MSLVDLAADIIANRREDDPEGCVGLYGSYTSADVDIGDDWWDGFVADL